MTTWTLDCAACGAPAHGNHSIHRDGYGEGPEVPLCDRCGSGPEPTCEVLWGRIAARAKVHAEGRFCGSLSCTDGRCIDAECAALPIRGHFGNDVGLDFAGGLDAEWLPRIAAEVRSFGASIDAEGRLRDGDEGGVLSLDKVRSYLAVAGEMLAERS